MIESRPRALIVAAMFAASISAQDKTPESRPATPAAPILLAAKPQEAPTSRSASQLGAEMDAVRKSYDDSYKAFLDAYRAAKTDEERQTIVKERMPNSDETSKKLLELVRRDPADAAVPSALQFVLESARDNAVFGEALGLFMKHHPNSPTWSKVTTILSYHGQSECGAALRRLISDGATKDVKGNATYALSVHLRTRLDLATMFANASEKERESYVQWAGKEMYEELHQADGAAMEREIEELLEVVVKEYGDVSYRDGTLGDKARSDLFERRHLAIGKPAPDITGEDIDGVAFKLSDYKGKVVLLDFWGHW